MGAQVRDRRSDTPGCHCGQAAVLRRLPSSAWPAFGGVFRFLQRRIIIGASRDIEFDLRNDFFARLQLFEPAYFHRNRTGDLMSRATNDLNAVRMMIGPAVMYLSNTVLTFIAVIVLMLSINRRLTLLSLIPLPILSVAVYYFGAVIHRRFDEIQEQLSTISAVTQEALAGVRVVRAYRQEPSRSSASATPTRSTSGATAR